MRFWNVLLTCCLTLLVTNAFGQTVRSGNPILPGWYADPEARIFQNQYWIFPTYSAPYDKQVFMDAFSSKDLVTWTKHPHVLDVRDVRWAQRALWAPSVVEKAAGITCSSAQTTFKAISRWAGSVSLDRADRKA